MSLETSKIEKQNIRLEPYLALSLLIHLAVLLSFVNNLHISNNNVLTKNKEQRIRISLAPREKRIVTQPLKESLSTVPAPNPMISEKNISVEKETVKKGLVSKPISKKQALKIQKKKKKRTTLKRNKSITSSTVKAIPSSGKKIDLKKLGAISEEKLLSPNSSSDTENTKVEDGDKDIASAEQALQQQVNAQIGIPDFLPDIREGELTLLNTKASKYAVFVRRVAHRVFASLKTQLWNTLSVPAGATIESGMVSVLLDKEGEIYRVRVTGESSNPTLRAVLQNAVKKNAWDHNPPKEAYLDDGYLHLLFLAKVKVYRSANPRRPRYWIMLSTGLE